MVLADFDGSDTERKRSEMFERCGSRRVRMERSLVAPRPRELMGEGGHHRRRQVGGAIPRGDGLARSAPWNSTKR